MNCSVQAAGEDGSEAEKVGNNQLLELLTPNLSC